MIFFTVIGVITTIVILIPNILAILEWTPIQNKRRAKAAKVRRRRIAEMKKLSNIRDNININPVE
uniref:Uncharacterized protein n=1 Tax=Siphoviridae sp. ctn8e14 TaxID=2827936 RepID=A0A8S5T4N1_9CAUD|nr:MAG TPA: hypothetical protein [Siphoviridae sp. ctn8e14]